MITKSGDNCTSGFFQTRYDSLKSWEQCQSLTWKCLLSVLIVSTDPYTHKYTQSLLTPSLCLVGQKGCISPACCQMYELVLKINRANFAYQHWYSWADFQGPVAKWQTFEATCIGQA